MEWPRQRDLASERERESKGDGGVKNSFKQWVNCASIYHRAGSEGGGIGSSNWHTPSHIREKDFGQPQSLACGSETGEGQGASVACG